MPDSRNRIFVSIGVSKPRGGLDALPGAITAAERMAAWAQAQGYITLLLHDAALPEITIDLLRDRITTAIREVTDRTTLQRLVFFFAGHGAALAVGDQYWILTHWHKRPTEAIKVSSLQRMLEYYGPQQVSVIGDACQEFSSKFIDLNGSPVLDRPDENQQPYELDQFFAVDAGKQAFMIKATGETKDFCLFTEVLLDALEGDAQDSYLEDIGRDKAVTSQSLALYLGNTVAREAGKYGLRMIPSLKPGFYTDRTYLTLRTPPPPPVPIHPPSSAAGFGQDALSGGRNDRGSLAYGGSIVGGDGAGALPPTARPGKSVQPRSRSVGKARLVRPAVRKGAPGAEIKALDHAREASRSAFVAEVGSATVRDHFETGCGICVSGAYVAGVDASFGDVSGVDGEPNWFRIDLRTGSADGLAWSDALVSLQDGRIVPVCVVNSFVAALHIIDGRSLSLLHRPLGASEDEGHQAIELLARAHAGLLSRQEIIDTAAMLREGKHRVITLGCIAAQFYDTMRDVDSLRAMAAFYALHGQPVPLDIVLYGGGTISDHGGRLYAEIPAVAAREPRTPQEGRHSFTHGSTPAVWQHPIAGRIPWMRSAWDAVATAACDASAADWRKHALAAMPYLAPGAFTVVHAQGRDALDLLAGITLSEGEPEPLMTAS